MRSDYEEQMKRWNSLRNPGKFNYTHIKGVEVIFTETPRNCLVSYINYEIHYHKILKIMLESLK